jgi:hypothetical protein
MISICDDSASGTGICDDPGDEHERRRESGRWTAAVRQWLCPRDERMQS